MKKMFVAAATLVSLSLHAQDCSTAALFQKGKVLTYKTQQMILGIFKNKYIELTRLTYTVDDVKDSNNVKYSYITKTGVNPQNDKQQYKKAYVVTCNGKMVNIPVDFYSTDTVFLSNMYPDTRDKGVYSAVETMGNVTYAFPLNTTVDKPALPTGEVKIAGKMRLFMPNTNPKMANLPERLQEYKINGSLTVKTVEVAGEETVKTEAGSYPCIKIKMSNEVKGLPEGGNFGSGIVLYNATMGVVRTESYYKNKLLIYGELVSIQ
jgi:hypothetical protein